MYVGTVFAQTATPLDLTQMSLEDLMNVQITSVSRKEQNLFQNRGRVFT